MPPTDDVGPKPGPVSIVVLSGLFERVHYALVLASAKAAIGQPGTLFFTQQACRALTVDPATGSHGWAMLPGVDGERGDVIDARYRQRGVATFEELVIASAELGVRFMVCDMGLRATAIPAENLRQDISIEITGAVTFFSEVPAGGSILSL